MTTTARTRAETEAVREVRNAAADAAVAAAQNVIAGKLTPEEMLSRRGW